jgi:murein DD-endopeptidase MepM/ murein hydrolase activator NlpD
MSRTAVVAVMVAGLLLAAQGSPGRSARPAARPVAAAVSYAAPIGSPVMVVRRFVAPAGPYAAGHRGVDLSASPEQVVRAASEGEVRFSGMVAGRGVVVISHPDGVLTEYEPVTPAVSAGARVTRGQAVGRLHGSHPPCAANHCLHWAARRGDTYLDPLTLLGGLGGVRLLPWPP